MEKKIRTLVALARELGINQLTHGNLTIVLGPEPKPQTMTMTESSQQIKVDKEPTEDELLFWSINE